MAVLTTASGQKVALPAPGQSITLGAGPHCRIENTGKGCVLHDLAGALVNGQSVKQKALLDGDVIQVEAQVYTYVSNATATHRTAAVKKAGSDTATRTQPAQNATQKMASGASGGRTTQKMAATNANATRATQKTTATAPGGTTRATQKMAGGQAAAGRTTQKMSAGDAGGAKAAASGTARSTQVRGTAAMRKTSTAMRGTTSKVRTTGRVPAGGALKPTKMKLIAIGSIVGLVAIGGIILALGSTQDDPEEIKAELKKQVDALNAFKPEQLKEKLDLAQAILSEERYKKYARELYNRVAKVEPELKAELARIKEADSECMPFLSRYDELKARPADYKAEAENLYGEVSALVGRFMQSRHGERLGQIREELNTFLESNATTPWQQEWIQLQADVVRAYRGGDFVGGVRILDEFGAKHREKETPQLRKQLQEEREKLRYEANSYADKTVRKARELRDEGKSDEAKKMLESAVAGLKGLEAEGKVQQCIKDLGM